MADTKVKRTPDEAASQYKDLAGLWSTEWNRFRESRERINECGRWRRKEVPAILPASFPNADSLAVDTPYPIKLGQNLINFLSRKRPSPRRPVFGEGPTATKRASEVEEWLRAATTQLKSNGSDIWRTLLAHAVNDGEFAVLVVPRPAHYSHILEFKDDAGRISARFAVDKNGNAVLDDDDGDEPKDDEGPETEVDEERSTRTYDTYERQEKLQRLPFVIEILPAAQCIPIGVDEEGRVDALLIQRQRTANSLRSAGLEFTAMGAAIDGPTHRATGASAALSGVGVMMSLYELWVRDPEEGVLVVYEVGGIPVKEGAPGQQYATTLNGQAATINLTEEFGINDIPGGYFFGSCYDSEHDPAKRGLPMLWPYLGTFRGLHAMLSAMTAHMWATGFPGWFVEADAELLKMWQEVGHPLSFDVQPMKANVVPGHMVPAVHSGVSKDVSAFVQLGLRQLDEADMATHPQSSAESGFGQGVATALDEATFTQIVEGCTDALRRIYESLLEQAERLAEKTGAPIPVYTDTDDNGSSQEWVEIGSREVAGNFACDVYFPQKMASDLAKAQAGYAWMQPGPGGKAAISHQLWLKEFLGHPDPDQEVIQIAVENLIASPQGQQYILQLADQVHGNDDIRKLRALQAQGKASPGGFPANALPPRPMLPPGGGGTADASGVSMNPGASNPAASAVGGIVGGGEQTAAQSRVIAATGQAAPTSY